jgi:8-oxo-dGTP pyrophosphatase MutT (NUDIX family)
MTSYEDINIILNPSFSYDQKIKRMTKDTLKHVLLSDSIYDFTDRIGFRDYIVKINKTRLINDRFISFKNNLKLILANNSIAIKYFMMKEVEHIYNFPGGHVPVYENPIDTAIREVGEETGISYDDIDLIVMPFKRSFRIRGTIFQTHTDVLDTPMSVYSLPILITKDIGEHKTYYNVLYFATVSRDVVDMVIQNGTDSYEIDEIIDIPIDDFINGTTDINVFDEFGDVITTIMDMIDDNYDQ